MFSCWNLTSNAYIESIEDRNSKSDIIIDQADCLQWLPEQAPDSAQLIVADPPYFQVMLNHEWDNLWKDEQAYLAWSLQWMTEAKRVLHPTGLLYVFGQPGKREQIFLSLMAEASRLMEFHDLIIWDRVVGYNERRDSFTPCYEMILVLRKSAEPYFNKEAVRELYDDETKAQYLKDPRYKDMEKRREHLDRGKFATNLWRIPSLKGSSKEKRGHPTQKPAALIDRILLSSSRPGDLVIDPFVGSGSTPLSASRHLRCFAGCELNPEYVKISRSAVGENLL